MKIQFKVYNKEIIDCSSCYNTIYPKPESLQIIYEILDKICQSDVVSRIGQFIIKLNDIELQSPKVLGYSSGRNEEDYDFHTGELADNNKVSGLYIEREIDTKERISNLKYFRFQKTSKAYYIEPGLEGVRKAINYIRWISENKQEQLPNYLKDINLRYFSFTMGVLWKMDEEWRIKDGICNLIDYERDNIDVNSRESGFTFSFSNFGGDSPDIYISEIYISHLNAITKILDDIAPGEYMAGPVEIDDLLKAEVLKKEGRKLVIVDEKNLEQFQINTLARDLSEQSEELFRQKYLSLKKKEDSGEKLTDSEKLELTDYEKILKARENIKKNIKN